MKCLRCGDCLTDDPFQRGVDLLDVVGIDVVLRVGMSALQKSRPGALRGRACWEKTRVMPNMSWEESRSASGSSGSRTFSLQVGIALAELRARPVPPLTKP